ncbi:MAG: DUF4197 domain-containing protein [Giesbergeria sp.]|nr:DUF4197 domain-containing protein [Giesbergeria sp.]
MQRRLFTLTGAGTLGALILLATTQARALSLPGLSNADASSGVKAALEQGAIAAVALLGQSGGFLNNPSVRIALPGYLNDAAQMMKRFGQGKRIEELETSLNRAAEAAVPMGKDLLIGAVQSMSVTDAKNILTGGDTSVTQFFSSKTRAPLGEKFLPVVTQATSQVGLAQQYNAFAGKAVGFGLVKKEDARIEDYVTGKTLDGLFTVIGEEERKLRQNPAAAGSALLQKVFGALK